MNCPSCASSNTSLSTHKTSLGYHTFRCLACKRRFNERTSTPFNNLQFPTDIVLLVVLFEFTHEAVRDWEDRFAPLVTAQLRAKRKGKAGPSWYADETYIKVGGKWHYLYRAIDRDGNLVNCMLSDKRDMAAAKKFFQETKEVTGCRPERVTTDGHDSYPRAIRRILGRKVLHRTNRYLNNRVEQDHRGVKQRYYPMRGFGNYEAAARFCSAYDEQRNYFRARSKPKETVSLAEYRRLFLQRFAALQDMVSPA